MITAQHIQQKLTDAFPNATIKVVDTTGTYDHFDALVVWEGFAGMPRVRQHQAVYEAIGDDMRTRIHALALRTFTPERYAAQGG